MLFVAGGVATPADAAMMMQLGADGVFVGSGIFKSGNPAERAAAIVKATTFFDDAKVIADVSRGLGEAMVGINVVRPARAAPPRRARLVDRDRASASSRCRATCASTPASSRELGADVELVRRPERARRGRRARDPRRRVERDRQALARVRDAAADP